MKPDRLHVLLTEAGIPPPTIPDLVADTQNSYALWRGAIGNIMDNHPETWDTLSPLQQLCAVLFVVSIRQVILDRLQLQVATVATATLQ